MAKELAKTYEPAKWKTESMASGFPAVISTRK